MAGSPESGETRSTDSGGADQVVRARNSPQAVTLPRELPGVVRKFVNNLMPLARLDEIALQSDQAAYSPVIVLHGTAGVGKTTTALEWAHRPTQGERFDGGQLYVNLRGYDPGQPVSALMALDGFLRSLGVPPAEIPADLESRATLYRSRIAGRRLLIVLDNAATVAQVRALLPGAPGCLVLVTSRSELPGLGTREAAHRVGLDVLDESDAILLLESVMEEFRDLGDRRALVEVVRLCARLPLALRIAAERAVLDPYAPLAGIVAELRDESRLWDALTVEDEGDAADVRAVFSWSYRALPAPTARLFRLLGKAFGPSFSVSAAAALSGLSSVQARGRLGELAKVHMIERRGADRFEFHDLLRAFAADQAEREETAGELDQSTERLLRWYLHSAKALSVALDGDSLALDAGELPDSVEPQRFDGELAARSWFYTERANLTAAVARAAVSGKSDIGWRLPGVLLGVYETESAIDDWISTALTGLAAAESGGDRAGQAVMLESLGKAYAQSDRLVEAVEKQSAALALRVELDDMRGQARSSNALGLVHWRAERYDEAKACFERTRSLAESTGDRAFIAFALANLGELAVDADDPADAVGKLELAIALHRELGHEFYLADALAPLSRAKLKLGLIDDALAAAREGLEISEHRENDITSARTLIELGRALRASGDPNAAVEVFKRALDHQQRLGSQRREAEILEETAAALEDCGRTDQAAQLYRSAQRLYVALADEARAESAGAAARLLSG